MTRSPHSFAPIGVIRSCFTEKFGVPRQSLMVKAARALLKLDPDPGFREALNHLGEFSHVWIIYVFHKHTEQGWRPTIAPPRVEAPRRVGLFASRSPHRPNPIGLSAVRLDRIDLEAPGGIELHLSGIDILDGTPVLDIKPYLPFADRIDDAHGGWADEAVKRYPVEFSSESLASIADRTGEHPELRALVQQTLEIDPRPVSQRRAMPIGDPESEGRSFGFRLLDLEVRWQVRAGAIFVLQVYPATSAPPRE